MALLAARALTDAGRLPLAGWRNGSGHLVFVVVWLVLILSTGQSLAESWQSADDAVARLAAGDVLLLRHALAPGFGDPDNFRVDDCATQRNLDDRGREQARSIGDWLRARGIDRADVYSSQWCRCLETAELLDLGPVKPLSGLNSFFQRTADRAPNLASLRRFLAERGPADTPLVLVTHQVTISALTGLFADSGGGVVATLGPQGELFSVARIAFGD